jgi:hypothetical protein
MSRFADPNATKRMELGPCECPGSPHAEGDWIALRSDLGADDLVFLETAEPWDRMLRLVRGWNLIGDDGQVAPVTEDYLGRLYADLFPRINDFLAEHAKMASLPNASAARSRTTSRASGSQRPRALTAG